MLPFALINIILLFVLAISLFVPLTHPRYPNWAWRWQGKVRVLIGRIKLFGFTSAKREFQALGGASCLVFGLFALILSIFVINYITTANIVVDMKLRSLHTWSVEDRLDPTIVWEFNFFGFNADSHCTSDSFKITRFDGCSGICNSSLIDAIDVVPEHGGTSVCVVRIALDPEVSRVPKSASLQLQTTDEDFYAQAVVTRSFTLPFVDFQIPRSRDADELTIKERIISACSPETRGYSQVSAYVMPDDGYLLRGEATFRFSLTPQRIRYCYGGPALTLVPDWSTNGARCLDCASSFFEITSAAKPTLDLVPAVDIRRQSGQVAAPPLQLNAIWNIDSQYVSATISPGDTPAELFFAFFITFLALRGYTLIIFGFLDWIFLKFCLKRLNLVHIEPKEKLSEREDQSLLINPASQSGWAFGTEEEEERTQSEDEIF